MPDVAQPFVAQQLAASEGPLIAVSDYVRAVPESIRAYLPAGRRFVTLGTDGFGRSDTRAELRAFFEVDRHAIVLAAIHALHQEGRVDDAALERARTAAARMPARRRPGRAEAWSALSAVRAGPWRAGGRPARTQCTMGT